MTHDELLIEINRRLDVALYNGDAQSIHALRAVVELHKPTEYSDCSHCFGLHSMGETYPCPTVQAIEKELG
jgi:hypothetical protein